MVVSNHITGTLAVLPVAEDGTLRPVSQLVTLEGKPGPHRTEQPFAKPHFNPFSPCGRWVLVPDKGLDKVFVFSFEDGRLLPAAQPHLDLREGAGPRHLAFHPTQPWVYVVNELDNTVTSCHFDAKTGALQAFQIVPTGARTASLFSASTRPPAAWPGARPSPLPAKRLASLRPTPLAVGCLCSTKTVIKSCGLQPVKMALSSPSAMHGPVAAPCVW
jgi:hypothetical protein